MKTAFALFVLLLTLVLSATAQTLPVGAPAIPAPSNRLPTLWIIGDSTVKNGTQGLQGWGTPFADFFDPAKINVQNRALGGRSSRTFLTEGLWDKVLADMKPGDFVLMQFGHNDGGSPTTSYRASLKGNGDETRDVPNPKTGQVETIHTFGWYLRRYIADAKAKGATPIVLSFVPRNDWTPEHKVVRDGGGYRAAAADAAKAGGALFVDLNSIIADHYDALGQDKVKTFFPNEHTHTSPEGARLNAACVVEGIKGLKDCPLRNDLLPTPKTATP